MSAPPQSKIERPAPATRRAFSAVALCGLAVATYGIYRAFGGGAPSPSGGFLALTLWAGLTSVAAGILSRLSAPNISSRPPQKASARFWRAVFVSSLGFVVALIAWTAGVAESMKTLLGGATAVFQIGAVALLCSAFALWMRKPIRGRVEGRLAVIADLTAFNLALAVVAAEVALRLTALVSPNPIFLSATSAGDADMEYVDQWRLDPTVWYGGFRANSSGYLDLEFERPKPDDVFRIVALGDSFATGTVPYRYNFLTLLEENLAGWSGPDRRVEVCNMGVATIQPAQYLTLLEEEGRWLEPDLVLVCFFLGNDFAPLALETAFRNPWDRFMTYRVSARLIRISRTQAPTQELSSDPEKEFEVPEAILDYRKEVPTLPRKEFLRVETFYSQYFDSSANDAIYDLAIEDLLRIHDVALAVSGKPLVVAVIPDELQVNDALRQELSELTQSEFDLHKPMRYLRQQLEPEGVILIDLLPALQEAQQKLGRTYHLQNTHWNANGNAVAAEEIARQLRNLPELVEAETPLP